MPITCRVHFGAFELDVRSGELFRNGSKVRMQNQPFQVLALLLEHAGNVVTREEFRNRLWAEDTFVDFDRGLNKAINGLRSVLRDHAKKPRFIETLPHRGYRFIAPVEAATTDTLHVVPRQSQILAQPARIDSLAVLPLDDHCGEAGQEYFCDGMTGELISALSKISSLRVISRTSVMNIEAPASPCLRPPESCV